MEPWPLESTKRSRPGHAGFFGLWRRKRRHSTSAISAMPIGMPGWPEFAFWTASIASARMAFTRSAWEAAARGREASAVISDGSGIWECVSEVRFLKVPLEKCGKKLENAIRSKNYAIILAHFFTAIFFAWV